LTGLAVDLVSASRLVECVIELADRDGERAEIVQVLDRLLLPIAVFGAGSHMPRLTNLAWRTELSRLPAALHEPMLALERTGIDQTLEIAKPTGITPAYYAAYLRLLRRTDDGATRGAIVLCLDSTDEVVARALGVPMSALIWGGELRCPADYYNQAWHRYAGARADWEGLHRGEAGACSEALDHAERPGATAEVDARIARHDGEYRWHRVMFTVVTSEARWYATATDIHAAHALARESNASASALRADAEHVSRLKNEFIAIVSHELRAPVTTMLLWEKILREQTDPAARSQALDAIRESALAQSRLVGDLLDVSRATSGKLHVDLRPILLGDAITGALAAASPIAASRRISLLQKGPPPGLILGDMARLRQVLDNVVTNAIKFTAPGGSVTIRTRALPRELAIEIEDTGRGIPPELLEKIFEPFHQAEAGLAQRHGGRGLGLAISRQLVQLHGGTLTASSPGVGRGSTFSIKLPLTRGPGAREPNIDPPRSSIENRRVLVIDDDERVRAALLLLLRRTGASVHTASSAAQARERLADTPPEVILCDVSMPEEDGCSFIRAARAAGCTVPAIALTAHAMEVDAARVLEAGFDVHLAKPVHFERLVATIGSLLIT
jgi:signal transduction histidine kinase/CheY-like chemotaxis protein